MWCWIGCSERFVAFRADSTMVCCQFRRHGIVNRPQLHHPIDIFQYQLLRGYFGSDHGLRFSCQDIGQGIHQRNSCCTNSTCTCTQVTLWFRNPVFDGIHRYIRFHRRLVCGCFGNYRVAQQWRRQVYHLHHTCIDGQYHLLCEGQKHHHRLYISSGTCGSDCESATFRHCDNVWIQLYGRSGAPVCNAKYGSHHRLVCISHHHHEVGHWNQQLCDTTHHHYEDLLC